MAKRSAELSSLLMDNDGPGLLTQAASLAAMLNDLSLPSPPNP